MDLAINERVAIGDNSGTRTKCIFRSHGDRAYTKIRNAFLQDRRISDETRGLVARLLSMPEDWEITVQGIIASGKAGRDKVYRMLAEAELHGYIKPERPRNDDGTMRRQMYLVSDDPDELIRATAEEIYAIELATSGKAGSGPLPGKPEVDTTSWKAGSGEDSETPLPEKPEVACNQPIPSNEPSGNQPLPGKPEVASTSVKSGCGGYINTNLGLDLDSLQEEVSTNRASENPIGKPKKEASRKFQLPADWEPSKNTLDWAAERIADDKRQIAAQLDAFKDSARANLRKYADWDLAFRTWLRNAKSWGQFRVPRDAPAGPKWARDKDERKAKARDALDALRRLEQAENTGDSGNG